MHPDPPAVDCVMPALYSCLQRNGFPRTARCFYQQSAPLLYNEIASVKLFEEKKKLGLKCKKWCGCQEMKNNEYYFILDGFPD